MKIGVDLDNTTVVFEWRQLYNDWFDADVPLESVGWDDLVTLTHFQDAGKFFDWFDRAGGWENMPYVVGARGGIDALLEAGHHIDFITARGPEAREATMRWHAASPWAKSTRVTLRSDKWNVPCGVYVDDSPHTIRGLFENRKAIIIFDQPWNRQVHEVFPILKDTPGPIIRALGWRDVVAAIEEMSTPLLTTKGTS